MPPKKKAAKAKAPAADRKYSYLPRDLQRAAQHMDRVAFIRQLQRAQSDRQYKHVTTQTGSELSSTGAVDLAGKIDLFRSEMKSAMSGLGTAIGQGMASQRASSLPRRYRRPDDEPEFMGGFSFGGSSGSGYR